MTHPVASLLLPLLLLFLLQHCVVSEGARRAQENFIQLPPESFTPHVILNNAD